MSMDAKVLLVVSAILLGIIAGLITGILMRANGSSLAGAVLGGGGSFAVTVTLVIGVCSSVGLFST